MGLAGCWPGVGVWVFGVESWVFLVSVWDVVEWCRVVSGCEVDGERSVEGSWEGLFGR